MDETLGIDDYELEAWIGALGSMPVKRVAHADLSRSYEMTRAHVFILENGRAVLVTESGCSCYEPRDADMEFFPTQVAALKALERWKKENPYE